jgi:hypothetical protein
VDSGDFDQLKQYLKENLRVRITKTNEYGYGGENVPTVNVILVLENEEFSESSVTVD